jgi:uncharacterized protein YuzE
MAASVTHIGQFELSYDRDADVLYISIGSPRPAHTYEEEQGLLIRKDPRTGETVGVTILDYEEYFRQLPDLSWYDHPPALVARGKTDMPEVFQGYRQRGHL